MNLNERLVFDVVGGVIVISTKAGVEAYVARHRAALARADEPGGVALGRELPEVHFDALGLSAVLDFLDDVTGARLEIDWKQLKDAGFERGVPVTIRAQNVKFGQVLQLVLDEASASSEKSSLVFTVENDRSDIAPVAKDAPLRKPKPNPNRDGL